MGNKGSIFKIKTDGSADTCLLSFYNTNGFSPNGSLYFDGTYLFGTTVYGGTNNYGTIYKLKTNGTGYSNIFNFNGGNGNYPNGGLISDGTYLYGMTEAGGVSDSGTVYKIKPDGTGDSIILNFTGSANGKTPYGSLYSDGTYLYGMTLDGGINGIGTIFKIKPDGTNYRELSSFSGTANGKYPYGTLISDGIFLYGLTPAGGSNNNGTVFKICLSPPVVTISPTSTLICAGAPTTLTASGATNYSWSPTTGLSVTTGSSVVASPTITTNYSVTGTTGVCYSPATTTVNILPISVNSSSVCAGGTATLTVSGANTYTWSTGSANAIITPSPTTTTIYTVTGTTGLCNCSLTSTVTIVPSPTISVSGNLFQTACSGTSIAGVTFNVSPTTGTEINLTNNNTSIGLPAAAINSGNIAGYSAPIVSAQEVGIITANAVIPGATCPITVNSEITYTITINPSPSISYTLAQDATPHVWDAYPTYPANVVSYSWDWGDGTTSNTAYPSHTYSVAGTYSICVTVTDVNGCSATSCQNDAVYRLGSNNTLSNMVYINVLQGQTTSINQLAANNNHITVYPNPVQNSLQVEVINAQIKELNVFDVLGNEIPIPNSFQRKWNGVTIEISSLQNGVYFIQVKTTAGVLSRKVVVQH